MNRQGFIILGILFLVVLIGVSALGLNRRAGYQARLTANHMKSVSINSGLLAGFEKGIWELTRDPCWRTDGSGEDFNFNEQTYNLKVQASSVSGYTDTVQVTATVPGGLQSSRASYRYFIHLPPNILADTNPEQICVDGSNNIYFADSNKHMVYKYDQAALEATVVAGNGTIGYSGDGGQATEARLNTPTSVAVDSVGNIYIADNKNDCIRMVDNATGVISTAAGICTQKGSTGDGGPATSAELNEPQGIAVDSSGNVFIADTSNHTIRMVDAATGIINRVAGLGGGSKGFAGDGGPAVDARLDLPHGVYVDSSGNIYIADSINHSIRRVDGGTGIIETVAGSNAIGNSGDGGDATLAKMRAPEYVFVDSSGNIYIADTGNKCVRMVDVGTGIIDAFAGQCGTTGYTGDGGPAVNATTGTVSGVYLNSLGETIISDTSNGAIRVVNTSNIISSLNIPQGLGISGAEGIVLTDSGDLFISDTGNHRILKVSAAGTITTVAGTGVAGYSGDGGSATSAQLNTPKGIAVDSSGNLYIADSQNFIIREVDSSEKISTVAGTPGLNASTGDGGQATDAGLGDAYDVSVDASGNLYIPTKSQNRVRRVDASGIITTIAGDGTPGSQGEGGPAANARVNNPEGVFIGPAGHLYIADTGNDKIRRVDAATGIITTVAGVSSAGYTGDGGLAVNAELNGPVGGFTDINGNIFIADTGNHVIRVVSVHDGIIRTLAGTGSAGFNGHDLPAVLAALNSPSDVMLGKTRGGRMIYIS
ncbi:MAG: SMP-30/gluconolactonase/LRE family protein, partial [Deltaproteobacteria bacterium]|nr:SMP-30/gluconolactonase/LRE family protein [Deltaproteobacteria bacterium]